MAVISVPCRTLTVPNTVASWLTPRVMNDRSPYPRGGSRQREDDPIHLSPAVWGCILDVCMGMGIFWLLMGMGVGMGITS